MWHLPRSEREPLGRDVGVPVVYAYAPSADKHDISVISDNVAAGRMAAEHLISCGRQRIVYVSGNPTYAAARDRVEGAKAALADVELSLLGGEALYGTWNEGWGRGAVRTLLARFPDIDGILCGSDQIARGALGALRDAGRDVPGDIAVMGHDNWEAIAAHSRPPLSSIDMNLETVGRRAAELLFAALDGNVQAGSRVIPKRLVPRGSTAPIY